MNNIDKAADVIDEWTQEGYELNCAVGNPRAIAERLADAGLLAPDPLEPDVYKDGAQVEWDTPRGYVLVENGTIKVAHDHPAAPTINDNTLVIDDLNAARHLAAAFLAATNHAEVTQR